MARVGMAKLLIIVAIFMAIMQLANSHRCQMCLENAAYCVTENEYFVCLGDQKFGPLYCKSDEVCTNSINICENRSNLNETINNICGEQNGLCQVCSKGDQFTCVSRTQAALCRNGEIQPTAITNCGKDEVCSSAAQEALDKICVPNCVVDFVTDFNASCSNVAYTPPTQTPPTTPGPNEMQAICTAAAVGKNTRYFFAYADGSCRTYVYCEKQSLSSDYFDNTFTGSCSAPKIYFNTVSGTCQSTKPDSCHTDAPTTRELTTIWTKAATTTTSNTPTVRTTTTTDSPTVRTTTITSPPFHNTELVFS